MGVISVFFIAVIMCIVAYVAKYGFTNPFAGPTTPETPEAPFDEGPPPDAPVATSNSPIYTVDPGPPAPPPPPSPVSWSLASSATREQILFASAAYYNSKVSTEMVWDLDTNKVNIVDSNTADVYFAYKTASSTSITGYDWRRFTFTMTNGVLSVASMGASKSGITVEPSVVPPVVPTQFNINNTTKSELVRMAGNFYLSNGKYVMVTDTAKINIVSNTEADVYYAYIDRLDDAENPAVLGYGWRRFTYGLVNGSVVVTKMGDAKSGVTVAPTTFPVKYGDTIRIKNLNPTYGGYMASCGSLQTTCGVNITIRPDSSITSAMDENKIRGWKIQKGQSTGNLEVRYGDVVTLQNLYNNLFAAPCGSGVSTCGDVNISLRPSTNTPDQSLLKWTIEGGNVGDVVQYGQSIRIRSVSSPYANHGNRLMDVCGSVTGCGWNVGFRPTVTAITWSFETPPSTGIEKFESMPHKNKPKVYLSYIHVQEKN